MAYTIEKDPTAPLRCIIYARLSKNRTGELSRSVKLQIKDCKARAKREGWEVVEVIEDDDTSADPAKGERYGYLQLLAAMRAEECDVVLAYHFDRLWRDTGQHAIAMALAKQHGITFALTEGSDIDPEDVQDELLAAIMAAFAQYERSRIVQRILRTHLAIAEAGGFSGGPRSLGYEQIKTEGMKTTLLKVVPEEARRIREGVVYLLAGGSLTSLTEAWNAEQFKPVGRAKAWRPNMVKAALLAPRIAGLRFHRGIEYQAQWEAIITPAQRDALARLFDARKQPAGRKARYLLTGGIARCGVCKARMFVTGSYPKGKEPIRTYRCPDPRTHGTENCGTVFIGMERTDAVVLEKVVALLDSKELPKQIKAMLAEESDDGVADNYAEITRQHTLLEAAEDDYADGLLEATQLKRITDRINGKVELLSMARKKATEKNTMTGLAGLDIPKARRLLLDPKRDPLEKREVIEALVEHVWIEQRTGPKGAFDPARIRVVPRLLG